MPPRNPKVICGLCVKKEVKRPQKRSKYHFCSDCWLHRNYEIKRILQGLPPFKPLKPQTPRRLRIKPTCPVCQSPVLTAYVKDKDPSGDLKTTNIGKFCRQCKEVFVAVV